jgi:hypothetical protein
MPNRFNNLEIGNDKTWIKFDKSIIGCSTGIIKYEFKCSIKPTRCQHKGEYYFVDLSEKYRLTRFSLLSDAQRKRIIVLELGEDQHHPHKNPKTNDVCLGKLKGMLINRSLIPPLIICLGTYNEDDCYELPDACSSISLKEIYGGNQCQIF